MANRILAAAGFDAPSTKWASHPNLGGKEQQIPIIDDQPKGLGVWLLQRHYTEQFGGEIRPNGWSIDVEEYRNSKDPVSWTRLVLFDYLINNSIDRHAGNYLTIRDSDGTLRVGIIDEGYAFGAVHEQGGMKHGDRADNREFPRFMRKYNHWGYDKYAAQVAGSRRELARHMEKVLAGFEQVDIKKLGDELKSRDLDPKQQEWVDTWLSEFDTRRKWLRANFDRSVGEMAANARIT
jgi:hypothetical protein